MQDKVEVSKITIAYPDGDAKEMTIEHARELHKQLAELFGETQPPVVYPAPIIIDRPRWPYWYSTPSTITPTRVEWTGDSPRVWCHNATPGALTTSG